MFQLSFVSVTVGRQVTNQKYSSVLTVSDHIFHLSTAFLGETIYVPFTLSSIKITLRNTMQTEEQVISYLRIKNLNNPTLSRDTCPYSAPPPPPHSCSKSRGRNASGVRGEERENINACTHTIVQAVPAFKYERGYLIGYQGTTRGKEKIFLTSVEIEPTTSGLDLPLLCRLSYEVGQGKSGRFRW